MAGETWTYIENDLIIADYFAMLKDDLAGQPDSEAERDQPHENVADDVW